MDGKQHYANIRRKIMVGMIIVPMVPFVLILTIGYGSYRASLAGSAKENMRNLASDHRSMVSAFLQERLADIALATAQMGIEGLSDQTVLAEILTDLRGVTGAFVDMGVVDPQGVQISYAGPYDLKGKRYSDALWYQEALGAGSFVSDVFFGYRNEPHFVVALARRLGSELWVVRATIDSSLFSRVVEDVRLGATGVAYVVSRDGRFQSDLGASGVLDEPDPDAASYEWPAQGVRTWLGKASTGDDYLYAATTVNDGRWLLLVRQQKTEAFKAVHTAGYLVLAVFALGGALVVGLSLYLSGRIERELMVADMEKEKLHDQLVRAVRLAELGEMAAGFAHEINNPLQVMKSDIGLMELILDETPKDEPVPEKDRSEIAESMEQLKVQIGRCAAITRAILKFGRQGEPERKDVDLDEYLPEVVSMVERKAKAGGIDLGLEVSPGTPNVFVDPGQLQQVVLNLLNNAVYAVAERHGPSGGQIRVTAAPSGDGGAEIRVRDNGQGITEENLKKIFTPFFTTKPPEKGTGLGLSVCYGIIDQMGGRLEVKSTRGDFTEFSITLPAVKNG